MTASSDASPPAASLRVPDLGDVQDVAVIDVLVRPGDRVEVDTPLVTLESDKATMDVPATAAGVVTQVLVKAGDKVSSGTVIATLASAASTDVTATHGALRASEPYGGEPYLDTVPIKPMPHDAPARTVPAAGGAAPDPVRSPAAVPAAAVRHSFDFDLVVLGAGPGGYTAAFRAADLGLSVALIERGPTLGGVCLNVGCIPSKALLHAARVIEDAESMAEFGVRYGPPEIDATKLRDWKNGIVARLTGGLGTLARQRKVTVIRGEAVFVAAHELQVGEGGTTRAVSFDKCIIAAGSEPLRLPGLPDDPRIIDSTGALELDLPDARIALAPRRDVAVADDVLRDQRGISAPQCRDRTRQRRVLRVLVAARIGALELDADRVVVAALATPPLGLAGMPRPPVE